ELQQCITARLPEVDTSNLLSAHNHVNRILQEETCRLFPTIKATDQRVSAQPGYRTLARHVWGIYHRLKHPGVCAFRNIFTKWRLAAEFAQASRQLRQQSRVYKREFYEMQVDLAEEAAARGDQRSLHLIVRRLSSQPRQIASRLRGPDGSLLTREAELQTIVQHSNGTFAVHPDDTPLVPLEADYIITDSTYTAELRKLGIAKAVPKHVAPSATWKLCAQAVGSTLSSALRSHLQQGTAAQLDEDWKNSYVVWIPKPNKPPDKVASLRPIGLTSPASKALAGSLRDQLLQHLQPQLKDLPQFAYAKQRGTADAIAKAHSHFHQVDNLLQQTKANRFQQQAGRRGRLCAGGLCISLDLSRAFDGVTRSHIYHTMKQQQVPQDVITLVQQLHKEASRLKRDHTFMKAGQLHLKLRVNDRDCSVPIKDQHEYLGLRKLLNGSPHLGQTPTSRLALDFLDKQATNLEAILLKAARRECQPAASAIVNSSDSLPAAIKQPPTAQLPIFADADSKNLPLVMYVDRGDPHAINEEVEIFAGNWDSPPEEYYLSETANRSHKRHRPEQQPRWNMPQRRMDSLPSYSSPQPFRDQRPQALHGPQDQLNLLSKVVLKQEEIISRLRHEKIFVLFRRNEANGTLGTLMKIAKDWRTKKDSDEEALQSPLRTVLLASMLREVMNLAQQAVATEEAKAKHIQSEWLSSTGAWNYRV
ncbi:Pol, partial [Symbiodinium necroappetens]